MKVKDKQIASAAATFAVRWAGRGYEKGDTQKFWMELLHDVFGIDNPGEFILFEEQVKMDTTGFIDAHIPSSKVLIEQKSLGVNLRASTKIKNGKLQSVYGQALDYIKAMPKSKHPDFVVTCNFSEFNIYDMEHPSAEPQVVKLSDLGKEYYRLMFLVDTKRGVISREEQVSKQAGELVGIIYEALLKQYRDPQNPDTLRSLNILCVRLVFCLYAEDASLFGSRNAFHDYLFHYDAPDLRQAIISLFKVLDTPVPDRDPYLNPELSSFPYVNGGLFGESDIEIPQFTDELKMLLLKNASSDFDWSEISPTIFGAIFESTLNTDTRRSGGMHYTSIENIHKVIDPLFLNELRAELDKALLVREPRRRRKALLDFQYRISSLSFLDPACGSGNFLTETYISLRRLENIAIEALYGEGRIGVIDNPVHVSIHQLYGIEINDFAVSVATTALWIAESQMLAETERIIHQDIEYLPLRSNPNIREGNALRMDWCTIASPKTNDAIYAEKLNIYQTDDFPQQMRISESEAPYGYVHKELNVIAKNVEFKNIDELPNAVDVEPITYDYIMGNPPFVGAMKMKGKKREDLEFVFPECEKVGEMDYVAGWYVKAAKMIRNTETKCAFVSTNSICQGQQVALLWKPMFEKYKIHIDFAYRTFRWDSESSRKAQVHCIIVGFSSCEPKHSKFIAHIKNGEQVIEQASNINGYLIDADNDFVMAHGEQISGMPSMHMGVMARDGGHLLMSEIEYLDYIRREPQGAKFIRRYMMGREFINNIKRYCFWLVGANPSEIKKCPLLMKHIEEVRQSRLASPAKETQKLAETPTLFAQLAQPTKPFIAFPKVSSEQRQYIPIGFLSPDIVVGDKVYVVEDVGLYHFGVLTSQTHNSWMRAVAGRMKSDYSYSNTIVYNNFPWCTPTEKQRQKIEKTAQAILDARAIYSNSSLGDMYNSRIMPIELRMAHKENDNAVMEAYGFATDMDESAVVAELFRLYQILTAK